MSEDSSSKEGVDLAAIEARLAKAFPGPWHWNGDYEIIGEGDYPGEYWILDLPDMHPIGYIMKTAESYEEGSANIEIIANAPTDIAALLARAKQQDARIGELEAVIARLHNEIYESDDR